MNKKIKVLVVDDSYLFREVISRGISSDAQIEVVAKASNPYEARDKILEYEPDVMICDVVMPMMNGIEFIKRLIPQYPIPVIVISTVSDAVFDAMDAGAVDFVIKPEIQTTQNIEAFVYNLIDKAKTAVYANVNYSKLPTHKIREDVNYLNNQMIAIGASTGGTEAICYLLKQLPNNLPGIVIVQHIPAMFSRMFADRLNQQTSFSVKEARTGDIVEPGKVFIAPGDQHMTIKKMGTGYRIKVFQGDKVNGHCPSVDVLFDSVAKEVGQHGIGIILTGMGYDGAKGLLAMRRSGARTIGQDEASSIVYGMPKVAYGIGAVEKQASLTAIPTTLANLLKKST